MLKLTEIQTQLSDFAARCERGENVDPGDLKNLLALMPVAAEAELARTANQTVVDADNAPFFQSVMRDVGATLGESMERESKAYLAELEQIIKEEQYVQTR